MPVEPFLGEIMMFAGNYAPRGWAFCDGQLMDIAGNQALFALIGTVYGGDGRKTFALPDLRGRAPRHAGAGPGLAPIRLGQRGGANSHTLSVSEMPAHSHKPKLHAETAVADAENPQGRMLALSNIGFPTYTSEIATKDRTLADASITSDTVGGGQPFSIDSPYLAIQYLIAIEGMFPPRP